MSRKSTVSTKAGKSTPAKADRFPLRVHKGTGYWCKKVNGRVYYFGKVASDPEGKAALAQYKRDKDDLEAGREPRDKVENLTVDQLCFKFLEGKEERRDNGELSPRTWQGYHATCATLRRVFGKNRSVADIQPIEFGKLRSKLAKKRGHVSLRNEMQRVRSVFKYAFDEGLIPAPIRYGQQFTKPKLDAVRRDRENHRQKHGDRMFEAGDIRALLDKASQPVKSMILLGINCGFGQTDLANMPMRVVDLEKGWVDYARVKTAVTRRIPLWPETVKSIREWLPNRPKAKNKADADLMFLTVRGARWVKVNKKGSPKDAISSEFNKLLAALELKRDRVSFYALRHGVETIGGETTDQVAVDAIMGHVAKGMSAHYRERISDDRLRRVTDHIRAWLFPPAEKTTDPQTVELTTANALQDAPTGDSSDEQEQASLRLYVG